LSDEAVYGFVSKGRIKPEMIEVGFRVIGCMRVVEVVEGWVFRIT
jgi:hypothetical protein